MDNFKIIYKILSVLEKSMDLENVDIERISSNNLGISQQRWNKYMEMLLDAGYIKGVTIQKYVTGEDLYRWPLESRARKNRQEA